MQIKIDGVEIERVHEIKCLGVIIDDTISWKLHIKHVQSKLSRSISILNKVKQVFDQKSLCILYCSLVLPYLTYCADIWGNNYKSSIHSVSILPKKAILQHFFVFCNYLFYLFEIKMYQSINQSINQLIKYAAALLT